MCYHPILIKNPNVGAPLNKFNILKDCTSNFIPIGCGHCSECLALKQSSVFQRVLMEEMNHYIYFGTLTYNDDMIGKVTTSTGYTYNYVVWRDFRCMIKRVEKLNPINRKFRYLAVSEYGGVRHRPHIHFLLFVDKYPDDNPYLFLNFESILYDSFKLEWRRNVGSRRKPIYIPCFTFTQKYYAGKLHTNYDFHYVRPYLSAHGTGDVAYYVSKYVVKDDTKFLNSRYSALKLSLPEEEFKQVWKLLKPSTRWSKGFGSPDDPDVKSYLIESVKRSVLSCEYPSFFSPYDGKSIPLSRYYRNKPDIITYDDAKAFYDKAHVLKDNPDEHRSSLPVDTITDVSYNSPDRLKFKESHFNHVVEYLNKNY